MHSDDRTTGEEPFSSGVPAPQPYSVAAFQPSAPMYPEVAASPSRDPPPASDAAGPVYSSDAHSYPAGTPDGRAHHDRPPVPVAPQQPPIAVLAPPGQADRKDVPRGNEAAMPAPAVQKGEAGRGPQAAAAVQGLILGLFFGAFGLLGLCHGPTEGKAGPFLVGWFVGMAVYAALVFVILRNIQL